jgi:VWFA-related protein
MKGLPHGVSLLAILMVLAASALFAQVQSTGSAPPSSNSEPTASQPTPPSSSSSVPSPASSATPSQPAKNSNGTYTLRSFAPLVVLDMVVTDRNGKPVKDLTRADFQVTEAAEPQTIQNFEVAGAHIPDAQVSIDSTSELDRLAPRAPVQIIVLDEFNTRFEDMAFARYSLKKFLEKQPDKLITPTMLIAVDLQHFTVLHDYTQNKSEIISALDHHLVAYPWQVHQVAWVSERYATAFVTLRRVAQAVMGHPGHKNMIWIGRGFPPYNFTKVSVDTENRVNNAVQDCVNVLRDARITLYTIDPAGLQVNPGAYGNAAALNDPFGGNYQFNKLASATGGTSLFGRNDVDAEIGTAIQDGANFYTLTYRPTNASRDPQKFRKISVTLDRPGLKVLTREGYYLQYGPGRVDPTNPSRRLVGDLLAADTSTMVYDGVPITVTPSPDNPDQFLLHLDGRGLAWSYATDTLPRQAAFILMVSSFDKKGVELKRDARVFKINATGDVPPTGRLDRNVNIKYTVEHNPKAVRARFTVRVSASGRIGALDVALGQQVGKGPAH